MFKNLKVDVDDLDVEKLKTVDLKKKVMQWATKFLKTQN